MPSQVDSSKIFHEINRQVKPILISIEDEIQSKSLTSQLVVNDHHYEKRLNRLKNQCTLLKNLRNELKRQSGSADGQSVMIDMEEYILLPITLIMRKEMKMERRENSSVPLQNKNAHEQKTPLHTFSDAKMTSLMILQSTQFLCISEAAKTMSLFIECSYYKYEFYLSSRNPPENSTYVSPLLKSQTMISCLISCAMALQYLDKQLCSREFAENALDGGEDCQKIIFNSIDSIARPFLIYSIKNRNDMSKELPDNAKITLLIKNIAAAMNGNILAQLSKNCIDCMLQSKNQQRHKDYQRNSTYNNPLMINSLETVKKQNNKIESQIGSCDNKISNDLSYHALKTLQTLILGFPVVNIWRSLLPGVFSGIFRVALLSLHSSQSSLKLAELSLLVLSNLLTVTLSEMDPESISYEGFVKNIYTSRIDNKQNRDKSINVTQSSERPSELNYFLQWKNSLSSKNFEIDNDNRHSGKFSNVAPEFLQEVNSRLPGPICVLLHLVPIQRAKKVKEAGIQLCRAILVSTHEMWLTKDTKENDENGDEPLLLNTAMELCLAFSNDEMVSVANNANKTLHLHRTILKLKNKWKKHQNTYLAPRIVQLIEELPALVLSGREINATNGINLINGYLSLLSFRSEKNINKNESDDLKYIVGGSDIGASFGSEDVQLLIRNSISTIIELDFDTFSSYWLKDSPLHDDVYTSSTFSKTGPLIEQSAKNSSYNFQHFRSPSSLKSVIKLLQLLGSNFGLKRCALFIDKCIAQIYEECAEARKYGTMLYGKGQHKWLRKRVSDVIMAKEMLLGCINNTTKNWHEPISVDCKDEYVNLKSYFPLVKILELLCKSILPIIIDPTIWKLPSSVEALKKLNTNEQINDERNYSLPLNELFLLQKPNNLSLAYRDNRYKKVNTDFVQVSVTTLHGNAHLLAQLLDLVGIISLASGDKFQLFLPLILLPFLEKTSNYDNHPHVKNAAIKNLHHIAKAVGVHDISDLFLLNFDYLVDSVMGKLNTMHADQNAAIQSMANTLSTIEILLKQIIGQNLYQMKSYKAQKSRLEKDTHQQSLAKPMMTAFQRSLCSLTKSLLSNFDQRFAHLAVQKKSSYEKSNHLHLAMVRVLRMVLKSLHTSQRQSNNYSTVNYPNIPDKDSLKICYSDLLSNFGRSRNVGTDSAKEAKPNTNGLYVVADSGFKEHHAKKKKSFINNDENDMFSPSDETPENKELNEAIHIIKEILKRMSFFLSSSILQIKIAAIHTLNDGFRVLGTISKSGNFKENEDKTNFLLPSLSEIWPSIKSQLLLASQIILSNQVPYSNWLHDKSSLSTNVKNHSLEGTDTSSSAHFIESGFTLIQSFIELDGDFFVDRFQSDVYPIISKLIHYHLKMKTMKTRRKSSNSEVVVLRKHDLLLNKSNNHSSEYEIKKRIQGESKSMESMLVASLNCIQSAFINTSCGLKLAHIIPGIGYLILPMLADENSIGIAAESTLRSMLVIDCSSLLRSLILMSGQKIPLHPLMGLSGEDFDLKSKLNNLSAKRALDLLIFLDSLTE